MCMIRIFIGRELNPHRGILHAGDKFFNLHVHPLPGDFGAGCVQRDLRNFIGMINRDLAIDSECEGS